MAKRPSKQKSGTSGRGGNKNRRLPVDPTTLPYRPCVGVMLLNAQGLAFVGRRVGSPDSWQMPQGGIDKGEDVVAAGLRELEEEVGTAKVEVLAVSSQVLRYDLPPNLSGKVWKGKWRGQEQTWVCARLTGTDSDINVRTDHPEFDAWKWVDPETLPEFIVDFKRAVYEAVVAEFRPLFSRNPSGD